MAEIDPAFETYLRSGSIGGVPFWQRKDFVAMHGAPIRKTGLRCRERALMSSEREQVLKQGGRRKRDGLLSNATAEADQAQ